jgi:thiopeptide-type bacteriocin biosynthesis protein
MERYGGPLGIAHAEAIFHADSDAVLEILSAFRGDEGLDRRWRLAVAGIDALLDDLGLDRDAKLEVLTRLRDSFGNEFRVGKVHRKRLAGKFREQRRSLTDLLDGRGESAETLSAGLAAIRRRSERVAGAMAELRKLASAGTLTRTLPDLATSFAHMHVNRLLRGAHRAQELVIYDFLKLLYVSKAARRT